jgi:tetratricopeptide (TPR) repeat protein
LSVDLLAEARRRLDAGDPGSALRLAEQARESSRASASPQTRWRAAHLVAEALLDLGDIARAREVAGEALRLSQASGDPDALGPDLNLLGVIEIVEERLDEAVFLLQRSYDLRAEAGGSDSSGAIESLSNLAFAMSRTEEEDEGLELLEEAVRRCERSLGESHARTAETLATLAVRLDTRPGSGKRARALHERALGSAEAAQGPDSALVARLLANVAMARINDGDLESAGPPLVRALELHERHFGPDSRWTGYVVQAQGEYAYEQGRYDDARSAFEWALVLRVRDLGPERRETIDTAVSLLKTHEAIASSTGDPSEDAIALEPVVRALDPAAIAPGVDRGLDPAEAAEQLRRIAARIESRRAADEVGV